jgi:hypothetical protein
MPCLYFEPTVPVDQPLHDRSRLPLIEEHDGNCRAMPGSVAAVGQMRWQCCNQGYSLGRCPQFPAGGFDGALRYSVTRHSDDLLELIWIEERDHAPFRHGGLHFTISTGCLLETGLDAIIAAQALAYCLSYVKRYREHSPSAHVSGDSSLHSIT